ncbi:MAG: 4-hydroxyphenylacetate 3-hydroxylase N-terminal domain-containing protein [Thermoleophilia bacterium]
MATTTQHYLRTGDEYRASLRDEREVWYRGERIEDVTEHPATRGGVDFAARMYDLQFDPVGQEALTYVRPDGVRASTSWLLPRTRDDLLRKLAESEFRCWQSFGSFASRQPNHVAWVFIGQRTYLSHFRQHAPDWADNLASFVERAERENLYTAACLIEPQGTKARSAKAGDDRSAVARVVARDSGGVTIRGAKAVATSSMMANELQIGTIYYPHVRPEESFWCVVPMDTPGLKLICREAVALPREPFFEHPLGSIGEELDALVVFDDIYVPNDRIYVMDAPVLCDPALFGTTGRGEFWIHLSRQAVTAEFYAGLAQLVVDTLGTGDIPTVQDHVAEITQYALMLRAGLIGALEQAEETPDGFLLPHGPTINAFRAYGLDLYPRINQLLQQMAGQGLVTRFTEADYDVPELREHFETYLTTSGLGIREKSLLMNLVFDVTSSAMAGRREIFENVNGLPAPILRHLLYFIANRKPHVERIQGLLGLGDVQAGGPGNVTDAWHTGRRRP